MMFTQNSTEMSKRLSRIIRAARLSFAVSALLVCGEVRTARAQVVTFDPLQTMQSILDAFDALMTSLDNLDVLSEFSGSFTRMKDWFDGAFGEGSAIQSIFQLASDINEVDRMVKALNLQVKQCGVYAKMIGEWSQYGYNPDLVASLLRQVQRTMEVVQGLVDAGTKVLSDSGLSRADKIEMADKMISKAESDQWTKYLSGKVSDSSGKGKMLALAFTAFLAVFREGAEVILFCQQYFSRAGSMDNGYLAVFGGIVAGLVVVMLVFFLIRFFGIKIPLKPFFMITSIFMAIMSIAFIGSGMFELFLDGRLAERIGGFVQDLAGTIPALEWMNGNDVLTFFGIYPTWITLGPQLILLVVNIVTFVLWLRRGSKENKKQAEA